MTPKIPPNRSTGRAGVNAARSLFEACNYVFQEIELGNDFGKDAYVDLVNGREVTGLCVALQIKSGESFRRSKGYAIPIEGHYEIWRNSSLPIAGIVFDPSNDKLFWCNISEFLQATVGEKPTSIPVDEINVLNRDSLETAFKPNMRETAGRRSVGASLLRLFNTTDNEIVSAISECFAIGRYEPRVLIVLRYLLNALNGGPLNYAIHILSHVTPHPDIFWGKHNWIPENVCNAVLPCFNWSHYELCRLFSTAEDHIWQRGSFVESLYMILVQDRKISEKMEKVALAFLDAGNEELSFRALYLVVYWADDCRSKYVELVAKEPRFGESYMAAELEMILDEYGEIGLF
ncbi:DUF4365 domain-containing protein [Tundrisphaera sp. TA3]|uniref:DUF4365 domain-containing protein n=1 Tax=Tundrisphaera sp. TA3 TaxID=3435775 RepID=UPI003EBE66FA